MPRPFPDRSIQPCHEGIELLATVRLDWLYHAAQAARKTKLLHVACALVWLAALHGRPNVALTRRTMFVWALSRDIVGQSLATLREHGLVLTWVAPGRARTVILTEPGTTKPLRIH